MFERFTDRARRVVVLAQEEARVMNHDYIGTEHLLLGLIGEGEGVAAQVLADFEVPLEVVRVKVKELAEPSTLPPEEGHIPFTPRAKKVMELSLREVLQLGHNYIGTEHILLGLIREGEGIAAQVLTDFVSLSMVRQGIIKKLTGYAKSPPLPDEPETLPLLVECFSLLSRMEPRHRAASLAYLNAWFQ